MRKAITKPEVAREAEHKAEAERLAKLPREEQRTIIAMHQADARNPKVPQRDRELARERAEALERLLKLNRKRKNTS